MRPSTFAAVAVVLFGLGCTIGSPEELQQEVWVTELTGETGDCPLPTFFDYRLMRLGLEPDPADGVHVLKLSARERTLEEALPEAACLAVNSAATCNIATYGTPEQIVVWQLTGVGSRTSLDLTTDLTGICQGERCDDLGDDRPISCEGSLSYTATQLVAGTVREPEVQESCSQFDSVQSSSPDGLEPIIAYVVNGTSSTLRVHTYNALGERTDAGSVGLGTWLEVSTTPGTWIDITEPDNDGACVGVYEITEADQIIVAPGWRD